jgi:hypothetical protein
MVTVIAVITDSSTVLMLDLEGRLARVKHPSTHRTAQAELTYAYLHASGGIRANGPSLGAKEDGSCVRARASSLGDITLYNVYIYNSDFQTRRRYLLLFQNII